MFPGLLTISERDRDHGRWLHYTFASGAAIRSPSDGSHRKSNFEFQSRGGQGPSRVILFRIVGLAGIRNRRTRRLLSLKARNNGERASLGHTMGYFGALCTAARDELITPVRRRNLLDIPLAIHYAGAAY